MNDFLPGLSAGARIFSVHGLTELIDRQLSNSFPFVWVRGEISDFHVAQSGHMYFSLKDSRALLNCVWYASRLRQHSTEVEVDSLTGEVFEKARPDPMVFMRNGLEIICAGNVGVYKPAGRYQLAVELAEPVGDGARLLLLEERKKRLAEAGYFAQERKRPIPPNPRRVALVTSPRGAAIHDFLKMARARGLPACIRIFPVLVQGAGAASRLAEVIALINSLAWADVIVVIRGGGSAEDLAEFNEEILATAIFNSRVPVLAGIGHEVDWCLADMTADLRAATPTHAAQLLWPLRQEMAQTLDRLQMRLSKGMEVRLKQMEIHLQHAGSALGLVSPAQRLRTMIQHLDILRERLGRAFRSRLERAGLDLQSLNQRLSRVSVTRSSLCREEEKLERLNREMTNAWKDILRCSAFRLAQMSPRAHAAIQARLRDESARLHLQEELLAQRDPVAPLQRGYALLFSGGRPLASVWECKVGDSVRARLGNGELILNIEKILTRAPAKTGE